MKVKNQKCAELTLKQKFPWQWGRGSKPSRPFLFQRHLVCASWEQTADEYSAILGSPGVSDTVGWGGSPKVFEAIGLDRDSTICPSGRNNPYNSTRKPPISTHNVMCAPLRTAHSRETPQNKWTLLWGLNRPPPSLSSQTTPNRELRPVKAEQILLTTDLPLGKPMAEGSKWVGRHVIHLVFLMSPFP